MPVSQNYIEKFITVILILYILSLATERICNFLKLQLPEDKQFPFPFSIFLSAGKFRSKQSLARNEKLRERRIQNLSILVGSCLSISWNINIISLFLNSLRKHPVDYTTLMGWDIYELDFSISAFGRFLMVIAGCIMTGFLASFGSKFWHDSLDVLYQVKNLREKISDKTLAESKTLTGASEFISTPNILIAQMAADQNREWLKLKYTNIRDIHFGTMYSSNKPCVTILLTDNNSDGLPNFLTAVLPMSGDVRSIETEVVTGVDTPTAARSVTSLGGCPSIGTSGCIVSVPSTSKSYYLTCSHTLGCGRSDFLFDLGLGSDVWDMNNKLLGKLAYATRNNRFDIALVETEDRPDQTMKLKPVSLRTSTDEVAIIDKAITLTGLRTTQPTDGTVAFQVTSDSIRYADGVRSMKRLVPVGRRSQNGWQTVAQQGDSGGIAVLKDTSEVLGLIVAVNGQFTYLTIMDEIFDCLGEIFNVDKNTIQIFKC